MTTKVYQRAHEQHLNLRSCHLTNHVSGFIVVWFGLVPLALNCILDCCLCWFAGNSKGYMPKQDTQVQKCSHCVHEARSNLHGLTGMMVRCSSGIWIQFHGPYPDLLHPASMQQIYMQELLHCTSEAMS